tara:strand:- start:44 stop:475 length:432 start_codon:yes stop_codon:yes gene_type:complete
MNEIKKCSKCEVDKPLEDFYKHNYYKDGREKSCKECGKARQRSYKRKNKHKGFIYIIGNPAWPNHIKIGRAVDVDKRLASYQTGAPLRDYFVHFSVYVEDCGAVERLMYSKYEMMHEWCEADWRDAKEDLINYQEIVSNLLNS